MLCQSADASDDAKHKWGYEWKRKITTHGIRFTVECIANVSVYMYIYSLAKGMKKK